MAKPLRVPPYVLIPRCASSCRNSVDITLFMLIVQKAAKKAGTGTNRRPKPGVAADRSQHRATRRTDGGAAERP